MNITNYLIENAEHFPDRVSYSFEYTDRREEHLSYIQMLKAVESSAAHLLNDVKPGEHVLLVLEPGVSYVVSFWACLYAGVVPVPVYPPYPNDPNSFNRLLLIYKDSDAVAVLTETSIIQRISQIGLKLLFAVKLINIDERDVSQVCAQADRKMDDLAFLQYTSGSTSDPKGVMITHENLHANCKYIENFFGISPGAKVCGWLPPYHDMGLIGGIITAAYVSGETYAMSPLLFLKNPRSWLEMITRHKAHATAAPDFAFSYCVRKIDQLDGLDLSSLKFIPNGAEPIQRDVLEAFYEKFKRVGFKRGVLSPCYGLAEATLAVTAKPFGENYKSLACVKDSIESKKIRIDPDSDFHLVSTGKPFSKTAVKIFDIEQNRVCDELEIGVIMLQRSDPTMSKAYYNKPPPQDILIDGDYYFSTGDLGTFYEGELYVTGRQKELIIINGRNYYPQDIEHVIAENIKQVAYKSTVAVQVENNQIAIVQEIRADQDELELMNEIKKVVWEHFRLTVNAFKFLKKTRIPKTSSGKIQRYKCKVNFYEKEVPHIFQYAKILLRRYGIIK